MSVRHQVAKTHFLYNMYELDKFAVLKLELYMKTRAASYKSIRTAYSKYTYGQCIPGNLMSG